MTPGRAVSLEADASAANVKARSAGRKHNRLHVQKALMEYLLLGKNVR